MKINYVKLLLLVFIPVFSESTETNKGSAYSPVEISLGVGVPNGVHLGAALIPYHHIFVEAQVNSILWVGYNDISIGWQQPSDNSAIRLSGGIANGYSNNPASGHSWKGYIAEFSYQQGFNNIHWLSWQFGGCFLKGTWDEEYTNKSASSINFWYALTWKLF